MPKLKRALDLFHVTAYGVGLILGAGIYAIIGKGAGIAGNALWLSFAIGALIAALTGLSYAELGSMYVKDAAEYTYVNKATGKKYLAFLISWLMVAIGIICSAVVALGFGGYLQSLTGFPIILGAIGVIIACSCLNLIGIKESANANIIFTLVEAAGLILVILLGAGHLGSVDYFEMPNGFSGVFTAAILVFFAFIGFDDIVNLSEETKRPKKIVPKAIILSIIISTILYILVSMVAVSTVPWDVLAQSNAPLASVAEASLPGTSLLLSIIALFATANTVLIIMIVESRVIWGMAVEEALPKHLSKIHPKTKTPWVSIIITSLISILFVLWGDIGKVAEVSDFGMFIIFIAVNASLILIRYKYPKLKRPFKVPFNIGWFPILPAIGLIITLSLFTFFNMTSIIFIVSILLIGSAAYFLCGNHKRK